MKKFLLKTIGNKLTPLYKEAEVAKEIGTTALIGRRSVHKDSLSQICSPINYIPNFLCFRMTLFVLATVYLSTTPVATGEFVICYGQIKHVTNLTFYGLIGDETTNATN